MLSVSEWTDNRSNAVNYLDSILVESLVASNYKSLKIQLNKHEFSTTNLWLVDIPNMSQSQWLMSPDVVFSVLQLKLNVMLAEVNLS